MAAATGVDVYINIVTEIAKAHFGSRIHYWNEGVDQFGKYGWKEVNESIRSYEQVRYTFADLSFPFLKNAVTFFLTAECARYTHQRCIFLERH